MKVRLKGEKAVNKIVSNQEGVKDAVYEHALEVGEKAQARLARHRDTGAAHIEVEKGFGRFNQDSAVSLVDEAALSIEFGHWVANDDGYTGTYVPGLYIVTGAAGLT